MLQWCGCCLHQAACIEKAHQLLRNVPDLGPDCLAGKIGSFKRWAKSAIADPVKATAKRAVKAISPKHRNKPASPFGDTDKIRRRITKNQHFGDLVVTPRLASKSAPASFWRPRSSMATDSDNLLPCLMPFTRKAVTSDEQPTAPQPPATTAPRPTADAPHHASETSTSSGHDLQSTVAGNLDEAATKLRRAMLAGDSWHSLAVSSAPAASTVFGARRTCGTLPPHTNAAHAPHPAAQQSPDASAAPAELASISLSPWAKPPAAEASQQQQPAQCEVQEEACECYERMDSGVPSTAGEELAGQGSSAGAVASGDAKKQSLAKKMKAKWMKLLAKVASSGKVANGKVANQQQEIASVEEVAAGAA